MSCMTCAAFCSSRILVSCCETISRRSVTAVLYSFEFRLTVGQRKVTSPFGCESSCVLHVDQTTIHAKEC